MKYIVAAKTDVGRKRDNNEDNFLVYEEEGVFIVADGMGGHSSGEVASKISVDVIRSFFEATSKDSEITWPYKEEKGKDYHENRLVVSIKLANKQIFQSAQLNPRYYQMGSTIVGMYLNNSRVYICHVGDSRIYRIRNGGMEQLTEDHSLLNTYIKANKLTPEEIENFPHKNIIIRALGMKETVEVDSQKLIPEVGDIYLCCSDGLSDMVSDEEILDIVLKNQEDLERCADELIKAANDHGGEDNITVLLVKILEV